MPEINNTVELYGAGYVTYKKTDVTFDKPLEITNADFVPGDVNDDGKVDADDKALAEKSKNGDYNEAADFDRNGKTDSADMAVFAGIASKTTPAKMSKPTVTGGAKKITVKWTKPTDESVTGYTIKYGTSSTNLSGTKEIDKADTLTTDITSLSAGTTYYVQIAAKNVSGTGEYSDIANAKTNSDSTQGGGGGGGGGFSVPSYSVSVDDVKHGTVTVSPKSASKGRHCDHHGNPRQGLRPRKPDRAGQGR